MGSGQKQRCHWIPPLGTCHRPYLQSMNVEPEGAGVRLCVTLRHADASCLLATQLSKNL